MKSQASDHFIHKIQQGFSLLEVLIAIVVLSIGLLGLAGLQASSLRNNHSAYLRSQATFLATDIIDRMRANRLAALGGSYDIAMNAAPPTGTSVVKTDLNQWLTALANQLPAGDGAIARNGTLFTVTIQWDDNRDSTNLVSFAVETEI